MKKFIAASAALAIVLTGAPHATAFSSMSSSSPSVSKPAPTPKPTPSPAPADPNEVAAALYTGHSTALENQGYEWAQPAMTLMRDYANAPENIKPYRRATIEEAGYTLTEVRHKTSDFKKDYADLMATPKDRKVHGVYGVYIAYGETTTTAYILTATI